MKSLLCSCAASVVVALLTTVAMSGKSRIAEPTSNQPAMAITASSQQNETQPRSEVAVAVKQVQPQPGEVSPISPKAENKPTPATAPAVKEIKNTPVEIQNTAGTQENRANPEVRSPVTPQATNEITPISRRNPVVEAVAKTRAGVVAIRLPRQGEKDMIGTGLIIDESGLIVTNVHVTGGKHPASKFVCTTGPMLGAR